MVYVIIKQILLGGVNMRERLKKISVILVCVALVFGSTQVNVEAKSKIKINKKIVTIKMGKTTKLKLKNNKKKIKWSSKNKKIATVSQKGIVKGKREGKTTIIAKVGKKKYKCKVIVKDPKKIYITLDIDKKREYSSYHYEAQWVNNVLTKVQVEDARFKTIDMKYNVIKRENGNYDVNVIYVLKKTYDYAGNNAGSTFRVPLGLYNKNYEPEIDIITEVKNVKNNEQYTIQHTYENVKPGDYYILTSCYIHNGF